LISAPVEKIAGVAQESEHQVVQGVEDVIERMLHSIAEFIESASAGRLEERMSRTLFSSRLFRAFFILFSREAKKQDQLK
jgi:hypothetical protein